MSPRHQARLAAFLLGVFVLGAALFLGGGGADPEPGPDGPAASPGPSRAAPAGGAGRDTGAFSRRNPFRIVRVHPPPAPPPAVPTAPVAALAPPPPPVPERKPPPVRLVGTLFGGSLGFAMLRDLKKGEEQVVHIGTDLGPWLGNEWTGVRVAEVRRNQVVLQDGEKRHVLEVDHEGALPRSEPVAAVVESADPGAAGEDGPPPPPPSGEAQTLSRTEVDDKLKNLGFLITQLSVQPFFQNGRPAGFKLSRIRPGSFVDQLGARNGDIIQEVNGKPVQTVKDAFLLYNSFKTEPSVQVKMLRGGQPVDMSFRIE